MALLQELHEARDHAQRLLQVVGGHVGELLQVGVGAGQVLRLLAQRFPALAKRFVVRPALAEVAGDLRETDQLAAGRTYRGDDGVRPEARTVLPDAPALVFVPAMPGRELERAPRFLHRVLRRVEPGEVLPDDLLGGVALRPLGAVVPAPDDAAHVEHEDGVVPHLLDRQAELCVIVLLVLRLVAQDSALVAQNLAEVADEHAEEHEEREAESVGGPPPLEAVDRLDVEIEGGQGAEQRGEHAGAEPAEQRGGQERGIVKEKRRGETERVGGGPV